MDISKIKAYYKLAQHLSILGIVVIVSSCANSPIRFGEDRIETPDSVAVVGPLVELSLIEDQQNKSEIIADQQTQKSTSGAGVRLQIESRAQNADNNEEKRQDNKVVDSQTSFATKETEVVTKEKAVASPKIENSNSAQPVKVKRQPKSRVVGYVSLKDESGKQLKTDGFIVTLTPVDANIKLSQRAPKTHKIDMEDKKYNPKYLSIQANDSVSFINKDKIKHNVFSSTGKNAFDLGTYPAGMARQVTLNSNGIVKIYCNIHAEMATFVSVSENGISSITDSSGRYKFSEIPPGKYKVHAWHLRGEKELSTEVESSSNTALNIEIVLQKKTFTAHKNKFGKKYAKNSALFDDEFY